MTDILAYRKRNNLLSMQAVVEIVVIGTDLAECHNLVPG